MQQVFDLVIKALRIQSAHADREQVLVRLPSQLKLRWQDKQKEFAVTRGAISQVLLPSN